MRKRVYLGRGQIPAEWGGCRGFGKKGCVLTLGANLWAVRMENEDEVCWTGYRTRSSMNEPLEYLYMQNGC